MIISFSKTGPGSGEVVDSSNDGRYIVSYTAIAGGLHDLNVLFASGRLAATPTSLAVKPGRRNLPMSLVRGLGLTLATAGIPALVTVTIRCDQYILSRYTHITLLPFLYFLFA